MAKRFNNLDAALKYLRPATAGQDGIVPDAPAGTPLKKYQDYKAGKVDLDYPRATASLPGSFKIIVLLPLSLPSADTKKFRTTISNRSTGQYSLFGLSTAILGIDVTLNNESDIDAAGFVPAKAICRNTTGTTATTTTSKITGLPYRSKADTSYTFPIGRTDTNATWGEQKAAVLAAVVGSGETKSVSFKMEKY